MPPSPSDDVTLDASSTGPAPTPRVPVELERGVSLGRYLILGELGSGGMGKVYAAYDPELDRKLAIKLLHQAPGTEGSRATTTGSSRLQREAQAMAKLSHRNVVAVHDVGTHAGCVFVAMEYVDGTTLEGWLDEGLHPWREVLDRFVAAGRGLAAAHAAGLIHRDFKPANVLLGAEGEVRVADFGLARRAETPLEPRAPDFKRLAEPSLELEIADSFSVRLTQTGAFVGTPAYMAPEQFLGVELDARSDQFSFCVALWEGLYGERPFAGDSPAAIAFAIHQGQIREPPASSKVPSWVRRVVERGLASDPAARWPDIDTLLRALTKDPAVARRRIGVVVLAVAAVAAGVIGPRLLAKPEAATPQLCQGAEAALGDAWDEDARTLVETRYKKLDASWAPAHQARLRARLDAWTDAWTAAWTEACAATRIRGEQSEDMLDDRMLCLERRRIRFLTFVESLEGADDQQLRKAVGQVDDIGDVGDCSDPEILHARVPPPADPERRAEYERLLGEFDAVATLRAVGRYADGRTRLEPAYEAAFELGHPTLIAEARYTNGDLLAQLDDPGAEAELELAYEASLAAGMFHNAARSAEDLAGKLAKIDTRQVEAERWLRTAEALAEYIDNDSMRLLLYETRGRLFRARGEPKQALESYGRAVALSTELHGADARRTADALFNYSTALFDLGEIEEAAESVSRARTIWADKLGPDDPRSLVALNAQGIFAWRLGNALTAAELFEELLEHNTRIFGPDHIRVASVLFNYGPVLSDLGDPRGIGHLERTVEVYTREYGHDSTSTAQAKANLAIAYARAGKAERGREEIDDMVAIMSKFRDDTQLEMLTAYGMRTEVLRRNGDLEEARALAERLRPLLVAVDQGDSSDMADLELELALIELAEGNPQAALEHIETAEGFARDEAAGPRKSTERQLIAARVLRALGREQDARARAEEARRTYLEIQAPTPDDRLWAEIAAWFEAG